MIKQGKPETGKRGRPSTRVVNIDATAEEIAQSIFRAAKKPDPSIRIKRTQRSE